MGDKIKKFFSTGNDMNLAKIDETANNFTGAILVIGYACAVVMIFYIALRYIFAKPAEKAHLKTQLSYLVVGVIMLISATSILGVVSGVFTDVFK